MLYLLFVVFGLIASIAAARPTPRATLSEDPPFQITHTAISSVRGGNTTIQFTLHDPVHLANKTAVCMGSWKTNSTDYPTGLYVPCGNTTFAWNMASFNNISNFILAMEHEYKDPAIGPPPYDYIDNFGQAPVNTSVITCSTSHATTTTCRQHPSSIILAPITSSIAKRR